MQDILGNEIISVEPETQGTQVQKNGKKEVQWVFTTREQGIKAQETKQKEKTGKVDYQLYQVDQGGKTLYVVGISPADAFGKCLVQLDAKVTLLTHKQAVVTVETMLASFDQFSAEQQKFLLDQLLNKNPVQIQPEPEPVPQPEPVKTKKGKK